MNLISNWFHDSSYNGTNFYLKHVLLNLSSGQLARVVLDILKSMLQTHKFHEQTYFHTQTVSSLILASINTAHDKKYQTKI